MQSTFNTVERVDWEAVDAACAVTEALDADSRIFEDIGGVDPDEADLAAIDAIDSVAPFAEVPAA